MEPFRSAEGIAIPFDRVNVDTDQIIPARFIMKPRDYDYSRLLFHDLRFGPRAEPSFPLDLPAYRDAQYHGHRGELRLRLRARAGGIRAARFRASAR